MFSYSHNPHTEKTVRLRNLSSTNKTKTGGIDSIYIMQSTLNLLGQCLAAVFIAAGAAAPWYSERRSVGSRQVEIMQCAALREWLSLKKGEGW
jgi:hypothetical protein